MDFTVWLGHVHTLYTPFAIDLTLKTIFPKPGKYPAHIQRAYRPGAATSARETGAPRRNPRDRSRPIDGAGVCAARPGSRCYCIVAEWASNRLMHHLSHKSKAPASAVPPLPTHRRGARGAVELVSPAVKRRRSRTRRCRSHVGPFLSQNERDKWLARWRGHWLRCVCGLGCGRAAG